MATVRPHLEHSSAGRFAGLIHWLTGRETTDAINLRALYALLDASRCLPRSVDHAAAIVRFEAAVASLRKRGELLDANFLSRVRTEVDEASDLASAPAVSG